MLPAAEWKDRFLLHHYNIWCYSLLRQPWLKYKHKQYVRTSPAWTDEKFTAFVHALISKFTLLRRQPPSWEMALAEVGHWLCDRAARSEPRMSQPEVLQRDTLTMRKWELRAVVMKKYLKGLPVFMRRHIEAVVTNTNGILFKCAKTLLWRNDFCCLIY